MNGLNPQPEQFCHIVEDQNEELVCAVAVSEARQGAPLDKKLASQSSTPPIS